MGIMSANYLVDPSGDSDDNQSADGGCSYYCHPLPFDQVEIFKQRHSGRNKEESEIADQEVGHSGHMAEFDDF